MVEKVNFEVRKNNLYNNKYMRLLVKIGIGMLIVIVILIIVLLIIHFTNKSGWPFKITLKNLTNDTTPVQATIQLNGVNIQSGQQGVISIGPMQTQDITLMANNPRTQNYFTREQTNIVAIKLSQQTKILFDKGNMPSTPILQSKNSSGIKPSNKNVGNIWSDADWYVMIF